MLKCMYELIKDLHDISLISVKASLPYVEWITTVTNTENKATAAAVIAHLRISNNGEPKEI